MVFEGEALTTRIKPEEHQMSTVWILSEGEDHEGGNNRGVYRAKALAFADFLTAAQAIDRRAGLDTVRQTTGGGVYAHGGCDWVQLTQHTVVERAAVADDAIAEVAALMASRS